MKIRCKLILQCFSLSILCLACQTAQEATEANTINAYFDLAAFFEEEAHYIADQGWQLSKTLHIKDQSETKMLDTFDLELEFSPFTKLDINRPSLVGKYRVDTTFEESKNQTSIEYQALDEKLLTRQLKVVMENATNKVSAIHLKSKSQSTLIDVETLATYRPDFGYVVTTEQDIIFFGDQQMQIEVKFVKE